MYLHILVFVSLSAHSELKFQWCFHYLLTVYLYMSVVFWLFALHNQLSFCYLSIVYLHMSVAFWLYVYSISTYTSGAWLSANRVSTYVSGLTFYQQCIYISGVLAICLKCIYICQLCFGCLPTEYLQISVVFWLSAHSVLQISVVFWLSFHSVLTYDSRFGYLPTVYVTGFKAGHVDYNKNTCLPVDVQPLYLLGI